MNEETCLVVLPEVDFEKDAQLHQRLHRIYDLGILPAVEGKLRLASGEELRLTCRQFRPEHEGTIPELIRQLGTTRTVIVDLDGAQPDVFYVAGACHGLALPTVVVAESYQVVPPILRSYPAVIYQRELRADDLERFSRELGHALVRAVESVGGPGEPVLNPIQDHFPYEHRPVSQQVVVDLRLRIEELDEKVGQLQEDLEREAEASRPIRVVGEDRKISFRKVPED